MKRFSVLSSVGILILCVAALILVPFGVPQLYLQEAWAAGVPPLINLQGVLRDGAGNPVGDGIYTVRLRIYDDSTAGSILWEETVPVPTAAGLFTLRLGDGTPMPNDLFATGSDRFIGVRVNIDAEMPRLRMISVAYATQALRSDSAGVASLSLDLTCAGCIDGGEIVDGSVGNADLANNAVTSSKIQDATISLSDLGSNGAAPDEIMKWNGSAWVIAADETGADGGWVDDGAIVRLSTGGDNVGIGTASPTKKLEVAGSIKVGANDTIFSSNISSNSPLRLQAPAGTSRLHIDDVSGNVGIGTANPSGQLHLYGSPSANLVLDNSGTSDRWNIGVHSGNNNAMGFTYGGATKVYFNTSGDVQFGLTGGNVGIGTVTPTALLHLSGAFPGLQFDDPGATDWLINNNGNALAIHEVSGGGGITRIRMTAGGNLGIGTVSPNTRLDVSADGADAATFNRNSSDGIIVRLNQQGITEGTISVSGTTVSYNAFTGSHYGWTDEVVERGELVTLTGMNRRSHDNAHAEIIYGIRPSTAPNDPACLGSYLGLQGPGEPSGPENPHLVMAVGNGEMWVVDTGEDLQPGDYLISSDVSGHAMMDDAQAYPIGHVVARVAEAVDWGAVTTTKGGRKHTRISVLFGNFVRGTTSTVSEELEMLRQTARAQQEQIQELRALISRNEDATRLVAVKNR